jgi:hypothetical protein
MLTEARAKLRKRMGPFWAQTQASVREILDYAAAKNVQLGFENRERFDECGPVAVDLEMRCHVLGSRE